MLTLLLCKVISYCILYCLDNEIYCYYGNLIGMCIIRVTLVSMMTASDEFLQQYLKRIAEYFVSVLLMCTIKNH